MQMRCSFVSVGEIAESREESPGVAEQEEGSIERSVASDSLAKESPPRRHRRDCLSSEPIKGILTRTDTVNGDSKRWV